MALRFLVASAHGMSPFLLLFKQEPITPVSLATCPTSSVLDGPEPAAINQVIALWYQLQQTVNARLSHTDQRM